jgi:NAD(P)-dependent dehydrogenase (short-subunit alcohol dehydrogenase family)
VGLLSDKVVIVTGGGRGIGREHCLELARRGARVVVVDPGVALSGEATEEDPADAVVAEIEASGGEAIADQSSVSDWEACERIVHDTVDRFGRLGAVVNNAGILRDRMITSMSESDFDDVIAVHLKGTFQIIRMNGWEPSSDRYTANGGGFLDPDELVTGMRLAYRAFPIGPVSTLK